MPGFPNFIIAGVPKAGTTALFHYLRQHPQIYLSPIKEPCYFAAADLLTGRFREETARYAETNRQALEAYLNGPMPDRPHSLLVLETDQYVRLFRLVKEELAIGEASVSYVWLPSAAAAIASRIPDVRLLFMLRHPADRAFSQHLASGYFHQHETFRERFLAATEDPDSRYWAWKEAGRYGTNLARFFELFPREQIQVHLYEDYRANPLEALRSIHAFLGVDQSFQTDLSRRHNEPAVVRFPRLHALRWKVFGRKPLSRYVPGPLRRMLSQFYLRRRADVRMDPSDRQLVIDYYREEVRHTADLIGRDLSHWLR